MNINEILDYETRRINIEKHLLLTEDISYQELMILNIIKNYESDIVNMKNLRSEALSYGLDYQKSITSLFKKGYFLKRRCEKDERKVEIYKVDYQKINNKIKVLEQLVNEK
ncbi:transcriptional regulator, SarA/Rot family [Mammaliicoccus sciuri]|uniref:transcriptional regulator, SarA/Rot family n=1 Tax=Mammaliicoccus sciuri TaxID=1296 RepID=UPI0034DD2E66